MLIGMAKRAGKAKWIYDRLMRIKDAVLDNVEPEPWMCYREHAPAGWWCSRERGHSGPCAARRM